VIEPVVFEHAEFERAAVVPIAATTVDLDLFVMPVRDGRQVPPVVWWAGSEVGDGLDIHHVMQDHPARQLIPGATKGDGPSIALSAAEHRLIPNLKGDVTLTPRQLLARDAWNLRNLTNAPNRSIQELIDLNKAQYPGVLAK